jgi:hypothetical protein
MKMAAHRRPRTAFNDRTETYSLSKAKTFLGRLVERAEKGDPVYIMRGNQRFVLQHVPDIAPIPKRPPGYFASCYTKGELQLENRLAEASPIEKPEDLE